MSKKQVRLKKIPLKLLIETLINIYERGAEYVDILGTPDVEQDHLTLVMSEDYLITEEEQMNGLNEEEEEEEFTEEEENILRSDNEIPPAPKKPSKKLTDEDLDHLI